MNNVYELPNQRPTRSNLRLHVCHSKTLSKHFGQKMSLRFYFYKWDDGIPLWSYEIRFREQIEHYNFDKEIRNRLICEVADHVINHPEIFGEMPSEI